MAQVMEETLGLRLLLARKRRRWTILQLERASGVPSSAISRYENDQTVPPADRLINLARALGTTPNDLLDFDGGAGYADPAKPGKLSREAVPVAA